MFVFTSFKSVILRPIQSSTSMGNSNFNDINFIGNHFYRISVRLIDRQRRICLELNGNDVGHIDKASYS